ncbi:hypothetical protein FJZ27_05015 [Candidatus Peribacteria bacterium]|nr:hypothetical protein [Candidatus Peribacteria bacterium]
MQQPKKLTREEVMQQLFDSLMEQIEPKLTTAQREQTAAELAAMQPKERIEWMSYYKRAYEEFLKRWPEFVAKATSEVGLMREALVQFSDEVDLKNMKNLERSFHDDTSSNVQA